MMSSTTMSGRGGSNNRNTKESDEPLVPVGMDLGSRQARVAVGDPNGRVVSNTSGDRTTLALSAQEEQGDDNTNDNNNKSGGLVFGDAALRLLHKDKASIVYVRDLLAQQSQEEEEASDESLLKIRAFLGHLGRLASDATASGLPQLRVAVSVPVDATEDYVSNLKEALERGIRAEMDNKNKRRNNKHSAVVVGTVSDPAAVCLAHGLLMTMDDNSGGKHPRQCRNVLVVDAGASGLTVSHLQACGTSRLLRVVEHERLTNVSGPAFCTLLAKHVCSQFERKHRVSEVWDSRKARFKLLQACEVALSSLASKRSAVHVTIDGLYEGLDCHIPVSPPRWEMLSAPLLRKAQALLEQKAATIQNLDAVLLAGSVSSIIQPLMDKVFADPNNNVYRGLPTVPPEEAVALGCARHAATCLSHDFASHRHAHQVHVPVSPVAIGIGGPESNEMHTVIGKGTPLPVHVVHKMPCLQPTLALWQLVPERKVLAHLENLPLEGSLEVLVELTSHGKLSVAVQGGPTVTIQ